MTTERVVALAAGADPLVALTDRAAACAHLALLGCLVWATTLVAVALHGRRLGPGLEARLRRLGAPGWAARGLVVAVGASVLAGPGVAQAAPTDHAAPPAATATPGLSGLDLPSRVSVPHRPRPEVVVGPGDTLWSLTSRLTAQPDPTRVAAAWPRLHALNRHRIGDDPRLLQPGTRLRVPATWSRPRPSLRARLPHHQDPHHQLPHRHDPHPEQQQPEQGDHP